MAAISSSTSAHKVGTQADDEKTPVLTDVTNLVQNAVQASGSAFTLVNDRAMATLAKLRSITQSEPSSIQVDENGSVESADIEEDVQDETESTGIQEESEMIWIGVGNDDDEGSSAAASS